MPKNRTRGQVGRSNGGGQSEIGRLAKSLRTALAGKSIEDVPHVTLMAMIAEAQGTTLNRALTRAGDAAPGQTAGTEPLVFRSLVEAMRREIEVSLRNAMTLDESIILAGDADPEEAVAYMQAWGEVAKAALAGEPILAKARDGMTTPTMYWSNDGGWQQDPMQATPFPQSFTIGMTLEEGERWETFGPPASGATGATEGAPGKATGCDPMRNLITSMHHHLFQVEDGTIVLEDMRVGEPAEVPGKAWEWFAGWKRLAYAVLEGEPTSVLVDRTKSPPDYWSNQFGWIEYPEQATVFTSADAADMPTMGNGRWEPFPQTRATEATPRTATAGAVRDLSLEARNADLVALVEEALGFQAGQFATDDEVAGSDLVEAFADWRRSAIATLGDGRPAGATMLRGFRSTPNTAMTLHHGKPFEVMHRLPEREGHGRERLWMIRFDDETATAAFGNEIWGSAPRNERIPSDATPAPQTITATFEIRNVPGVTPPTAAEIGNFLNGYALPRMGMGAGNAMVLTEVPTVVVDGSGGIYESCTSQIPMNVIVYDSDGSNGFDSPNVYELPIGSDAAKVDAWAGRLSADVDPRFVAEVIGSIEAGPIKREKRIEVGTWLQFRHEQIDEGDHGERATGPSPVAIVDGVRTVPDGRLHMVTFVPSRVQGSWSTTELKGCATVLPDGSDLIPTEADMERFRAAVALVDDGIPDPEAKTLSVSGSTIDRLYRRCKGHAAMRQVLEAFGPHPERTMKTYVTITYEAANRILEATGVADRFKGS